MVGSTKGCGNTMSEMAKHLNDTLTAIATTVNLETARLTAKVFSRGQTAKSMMAVGSKD